jgi:hypothetical protein
VVAVLTERKQLELVRLAEAMVVLTLELAEMLLLTQALVVAVEVVVLYQAVTVALAL